MSDGGLTRSAFGLPSGDNFSVWCPNGSDWVWEAFKECAQDGRDMASVYLGLLSILCFMVSSLPQYYSSCKTGNMDQAISVWFLLLWLSGDSCNLLGSFLAQQLPLQAYTAIYYVAADLLMLAMFFYYRINKTRENGRVLHMVGGVCVLGFTVSFVLLPGLDMEREMIPSGFRSRALLSTSDASLIKEFTPVEIAGFCIGSVSSMLYLCSRVPQMYTNFKRKSTEGVSFFLFALVILGNTTYGLSVLLKNPDDGQGEISYVVHHLPWLIGSLGTLTLDLFISSQFILYRQATSPVDGSDDEARSLLSG
ncbi:lysosomal amino acid transporter 1 homolog [Brachionichthys hirsutus]|uniref:lysosomal amino acid transporter 1 homolog n=1 Tax=Brachionichthys hirsutus TaxID=412623 RepID=UPI0036053AC9